MFAIVTGDELFFKVTAKNKADYVERGLQPFRYKRKGKEVALSYYSAPAECLDESRAMVEWLSTFPNTVGSMKKPRSRPAGRFPPVASVEPSARPLAI